MKLVPYLRSTDKPYSVADAHLSRLTVTSQLMRSTRRSNEPSKLSLLFDLAPDGGYLAELVTKIAVVSYTTISTLLPWSGMFLWPDPKAYALPGVTWHPALWCTDFPHSFERAHLADLSELRIS